MPLPLRACSTLFSIIWAWYQPGGKGSKSRVPSCAEGSKVSGSSSNSDMACLLCFGCHSSSRARLRLREELAQCRCEIETLWNQDALRHVETVLGDECRPTLTMQPARRAAIGP